MAAGCAGTQGIGNGLGQLTPVQSSPCLGEAHLIYPAHE